jgi:hypothetical protein
MRRDRPRSFVAPPDGALPDSALPLEYRYSTILAACFFLGLGVLGFTVVFGSGAGALAFALAGLALLAIGSMGLLADPRGFLHSMGRRLIVTDDLLQEVDEQMQTVWTARPEEIAGIQTVSRRRVFPAGIMKDMRAEVWLMALKDGGSIRIPVWLLPHRGERFKNRFETFRKPPPRVLPKPGHSG